jgi:CRISPR-associated endonuclease/helicase Cas3
VQIVWRGDLDERVSEWAEILSEVPPQVQEALPLPLMAASRWLRGETAVGVTDLEGGRHQAEEQNEIQSEPQFREYLIWRGPERSRIGWTNEKDKNMSEPVRPAVGDTIVVRSAEGGADEFGWHPASRQAVRDVADFCALERAEKGLSRGRLRIHPEVLPWKEGANEQKEKLLSILLAAREKDEEPDWEAIQGLVDSGVSEELPLPEDFAIEHAKPYGATDGLLWVARRIRNEQNPTAPEQVSEEADDDASNFTTNITLRRHTDGVTARARRYAKGCGLTEELVNDLVLAAELHDIGKSDPRFQLMLNPALTEGAEPLAKSNGTMSRYEARRSRKLAGYPDGARHEFVSVALAAESRTLETAHDRELVLHLIGTHHGYGRCLAPYWKQSEDFAVKANIGNETVTINNIARAARIDSGWADRFWMLIDKYGYWGLAYLESILRRADCMESRAEQTNGRN